MGLASESDHSQLSEPGQIAPLDDPSGPSDIRQLILRQNLETCIRMVNASMAEQPVHRHFVAMFAVVGYRQKICADGQEMLARTNCT